MDSSEFKTRQEVEKKKKIKRRDNPDLTQTPVERETKTKAQNQKNQKPSEPNTVQDD